MERYEAYKDSGVEWIGEIPEGWFVSRNKNAFSCRKSVVGEAWTRTQLLSLTTQGIRLKDVENPEGKLPESFVGYQFVRPNDLVMCLFDLDLSAVFSGLSSYSGMISPAYRVITPTSIDPRYASYWFGYVFQGRKFVQYSKSLRSTITFDEFGGLPLLLPSSSEQQAIADYLDAKTAEIDALVADCEREVGLLREYRKAVISETVTNGLDPNVPMKDSGVEWIGEIPEGWHVVPLKHITESVESGTSLDGANWPASENEKGILTLSSVYQSRFDVRQNKAVSPELYERLSCPLKNGTLLISRCNTSEWVGTAAYVDGAPDNIFLPDKLWQLSFGSDYICRFIQYALQANSARNYFAALSVGASSTMQNIAKSDLLATPIAYPSNDEVVGMVSYLDSKSAEIDSLIEMKQKMADKLREYRKSLISEAVTGKFKVPGV